MRPRYPMLLLYQWGLLPLFWMLGWGFPRLRKQLQARRGARKRWRAAIARRQARQASFSGAPKNPPLVLWAHVASAGEFLQMEPLLRQLRQVYHSSHTLSLIVSCSSVNALPWLARLDDIPELLHADVLPYEWPGCIPALFRGLRPQLMLYSQAELWPDMVRTAAQRGIPQMLIAARLSPGNPNPRRQRWPWKGFFRRLYAAQQVILARTEADAQALTRLIGNHSDEQRSDEQRSDEQRVHVGGDPGLDLIRHRLAAAKKRRSASVSPRFDLVAGSLWPADLEHLAPVLEARLHADPQFCALLAPHEPTKAFVAALQKRFAAWNPVLDSETPHPKHVPPAARLLILDRVGPLAAYYGWGSCAYVGGGFHATRRRGSVHNLAEPAAWGRPILCGPAIEKAYPAQELLSRGTLHVVRHSADIATALAAALADPASGLRNAVLIESLSGATTLACKHAQRLLQAPRPFLPLDARPRVCSNQDDSAMSACQTPTSRRGD